MIGVINGQNFGMAVLNTSVQQEARSGVTTICSSISHIPASVGKWGPEHLLRLGTLRPELSQGGSRCRPPPPHPTAPNQTK